jgi:hypothetical protein
VTPGRNLLAAGGSVRRAASASGRRRNGRCAGIPIEAGVATRARSLPRPSAGVETVGGDAAMGRVRAQLSRLRGGLGRRWDPRSRRWLAEERNTKCVSVADSNADRLSNQKLLCADSRCVSPDVKPMSGLGLHGSIDPVLPVMVGGPRLSLCTRSECPGRRGGPACHRSGGSPSPNSIESAKARLTPTPTKADKKAQITVLPLVWGEGSGQLTKGRRMILSTGGSIEGLSFRGVPPPRQGSHSPAARLAETARSRTHSL